jgi:hypothetical protein
MSTKIYNGYKFTDSPSLDELMMRLKSFGANIREALAPMYLGTIAKLAVDVIDAAMLQLPINWVKEEDRAGCNPLIAAMCHVQDRQREMKVTGRRDVDIDFSFEVAVSPHRGRIYAITYTEQEEFKSLWRLIPGVAAYPYWNNTDPPEGISESEWDARGDEWDQVLEKNSPPGLVGFAYDPICDRMPVPFVRDVLPHLPDLDTRLLNCAKRLHANEYFEQWRAVPDRATTTIHDWFWEYRDWSNTSEGEASLVAIRDRIRPILQPSIDSGDLTRPVGLPAKTPQNAAER